MKENVSGCTSRKSKVTENVAMSW